MKRFVISESFIYKLRYFVGYGLIIALLSTALFLVGNYLPGGLSSLEMQSAVDSNNIGLTSVMTTKNIVNLPYYFLQHLSITLFGASIIAIKLPSLILALLSVLGIVVVLVKWFKPSISVLTIVIAITTGQFLFIAQDGTANILYLFWPVCLLLLATLTSYNKNLRWFYAIGAAIVTGLSLYTPLSIYLLAAMVFISLLHPHLRYIIKRMPQVPMVISVVVFVIIITPLVNALVANPSLGLTLAGIPTSTPDFGANLSFLGAIYFGFTRPGGITLMTPFFELGSMLIILIGAIHIIRTGVTAKNYIITSWIICLIPLVIINPKATVITYLPLVLLLATGLSTTLSYWYRLFPNNPYARIGGLIPVVALVLALVYSGASRFVYGYKYDPDIVTNFTNDIKLIPDNTQKILVSNSEIDFYNVMAEHGNSFEIITEPSGDEFLATHEANTDFDNYQINRIITSSVKYDSDRFYLYKKIAD